jgi:hypothetical protein
MLHPRPRALLIGLALAGASLALAPLGTGCAAAGEDAGPVFGEDAGEEPPNLGTDGSSPDGGPRAADDESAGVGCWDFLDNDANGVADCDESACATTPLCCVGSSSAGCCMPTDEVALELGGCPGSGLDPLLACAGDATVFGSPAPRLHEGAFVPNGDERFDSGLVLAPRVDPRVARVTFEARLTPGGACAGCVDTLGVGLVSRTLSFDDTVRVSADVGFFASTADGTIRLLVGGAVAAETSLAEVQDLLGLGGGAPFMLTLTTSTEGRATLSAAQADGTGPRTVFADVPYAPTGPARLVAWGRSSNRSDEEPAPVRVSYLRVVSSLCDVPSALARASEPVLPDGLDAWWTAAGGVDSPSVVHYEEAGTARARLAFHHDGRIHLAGSTAGGGFRALSDPRLAENALLRPGAAAWMASAVRDPALSRDAMGLWELWFTGVAADGTTSIGRAASAGATLELGPPEQVELPGAAPDTLGWDGPTVLSARVLGEERRFLAVRRRTETGSELVLFRLEEGSPVRADTATLDASDGSVQREGSVVHRASGAPERFDGDEVASPALVAHGDVLRLYYAGRRGTRWSIGIALSADGVHWRALEDPVLGGSGGGFDALSVRDPAPVLEGGELHLYHTGHDGVVASIGVARHAISTTGGGTP